ncbi:SLAM family member 9-like [Polymixia lowei]
MLWTFRPDNVTKRIANVYGGEVKTDYVERFTGRLQLDGQTGSLTITDLNINDSGFYEGQVFNTKVSSRCFQLIVYRSLSPPYIKLNTSRVGRGCGSVTVECSVENSRGLTVSWYRGEERLNQTSSLDTSANLSLALEIQDQDDNIYRCLAKNPVDAQATELHIEETCLRKRDSTWCCQTLATVRLVLSSVVGVAMIVIVVDHFRPTSSKR